MSDELNRILKFSRKVKFQSGGRIFNQVKVFDKNGNLVKIIPGKKLESLHWHNFLSAEEKTKSGWVAGRKKKK